MENNYKRYRHGETATRTPTTVYVLIRVAVYTLRLFWSIFKDSARTAQ